MLSLTHKYPHEQCCVMPVCVMASQVKTHSFIGSLSHMIKGLCSLTLSYITFSGAREISFCLHSTLALQLYKATASSASHVHLADSLPIDLFTVVCLVTWPLNESEAGVDLVMIQTSLLFLR